MQSRNLLINPTSTLSIIKIHEYFFVYYFIKKSVLPNTKAIVSPWESSEWFDIESWIERVVLHAMERREEIISQFSMEIEKFFDTLMDFDAIFLRHISLRVLRGERHWLIARDLGEPQRDVLSLWVRGYLDRYRGFRKSRYRGWPLGVYYWRRRIELMPFSSA